jgi:hypothetical protein
MIPPLGKSKDIHGNKGALHILHWEISGSEFPLGVSKIDKLSKLKTKTKRQQASSLCACFV